MKSNDRLPILTDEYGNAALAHDADPNLVDTDLAAAVLPLITAALETGFSTVEYQLICDNDPDNIISARPTGVQLHLDFYPKTAYNLHRCETNQKAPNPRLSILLNPLEKPYVTLRGIQIPDFDECEPLDEDQLIPLIQTISASVTTDGAQLHASHQRLINEMTQYKPAIIDDVSRLLRAGWPYLRLHLDNLISKNITPAITFEARITVEDWNWFFDLTDHPDRHDNGVALTTLGHHLSRELHHDDDAVHHSIIEYRDDDGVDPQVIHHRDESPEHFATVIDSLATTGPRWNETPIVRQLKTAGKTFDLDDDWRWI